MILVLNYDPKVGSYSLVLYKIYKYSFLNSFKNDFVLETHSNQMHYAFIKFDILRQHWINFIFYARNILVLRTLFF